MPAYDITTGSEPTGASAWVVLPDVADYTVPAVAGGVQTSGYIKDPPPQVGVYMGSTAGWVRFQLVWKDRGKMAGHIYPDVEE